MGSVLVALLCFTSLLRISICDYCEEDVEGESCGPDVCYHGTCQSSIEELPFGPITIYSCLCDNGWDGPDCEYCCNLDCPEGYSCKLQFNPTNYNYDKNCYLVSESTLPERSMVSPIPRPITSEDKCADIPNPTVCGEHVCISGICNITSEECMCHKYWHGKQCDRCCALDCVTPDECHSALQADRTWKQSCRPSDFATTLTPEVTTSEDNSTMCSADSRTNKTICGSSFCYNGECRTGIITVPSLPEIEFNTTSCYCDDGWFGEDCEQCCDLPCENGTCRVEYQDDRKRCYCYSGYTGEFCEEEIPPTTPIIITERETPQWYWIVIGCSIGFIVISIGVSIYIMYILWTKRNILIMKIVRIFQSPETDDDRKLYDGCVSCSEDSGIRFCVRQIIPQIEEQMGYKLYVPCRDDSAGSLKAEEKIGMVEKSRRTILLISPEYLEEEWPRFEYVLAQQEMLRLRHKIIPIILSDVTGAENIDPVLKNMMQSLTCIVWPTNEDEKEVQKFWKRVELAMPKQKKEQPQRSFWRRLSFPQLAENEEVDKKNVTTFVCTKL